VVGKDRPDRVLLVITVLLVCVGIVMVYSSSVAVAELRYHTSSFFLKRHLLRALLGLLAMVVMMRIDYHRWQKLAGLGMLISIVLLVMVLLPKLGLNGSGDPQRVSRQLSLPFVQFQPSEMVKLVVIFYIARQITRRETQLESFKQDLLPTVCVIGLSLALVALEPDLGTTIAIGVLVFILFTAAGVRWRHLLSMGLVAFLAAGCMAISAPYRYNRLLSFINRDWEPGRASYHIRQSLISLGSGGIFGIGLGNSRQKLLFLPEPHTDFVFSILGEELGFIGAVIILTLFFILAGRGLKIARNAPDRFGFLLAIGITASIFLNMAINVAVVTSVCPTTGLPLPFISYGGSSLLFNLIGVGVLLNISRQLVQRRASWRKRS